VPVTPISPVPHGTFANREYNRRVPTLPGLHLMSFKDTSEVRPPVEGGVCPEGKDPLVALRVGVPGGTGHRAGDGEVGVACVCHGLELKNKITPCVGVCMCM